MSKYFISSTAFSLLQTILNHSSLSWLYPHKRRLFLIYFKTFLVVFLKWIKVSWNLNRCLNVLLIFIKWSWTCFIHWMNKRMEQLHFVLQLSSLVICLSMIIRKSFVVLRTIKQWCALFLQWSALSCKFYDLKEVKFYRNYI